MTSLYTCIYRPQQRSATSPSRMMLTAFASARCVPYIATHHIHTTVISTIEPLVTLHSRAISTIHAHTHTHTHTHRWGGPEVLVSILTRIDSERI